MAFEDEYGILELVENQDPINGSMDLFAEYFQDSLVKKHNSKTNKGILRLLRLIKPFSKKGCAYFEVKK